MTTLLTLSTVLALWGPASESDSSDPAAATPPAADPAATPPADDLGDAPPGDAPPSEGATDSGDALSDPTESSGDSSGDADAPEGSNTETPDDAKAPGLPGADQPAPAPTTMAPVKSRPPRPIRWRLDFGLGAGGTVVSDLGYRAFSEGRTLPGPITSVMFDFRLGQSRLFLGGGLAYQWLGRDAGYAYSTLNTELTVHEPTIQGRLSVMAIEGIDAFARFGVGPSFAHTEYYAFENADQRAVLPHIDGQAGISLYLPKAWLRRKKAARITGGLQLGMGYTWRGRVEAQPVLDQGDEPLPANTSPWGDLSLGGLSWRVGLFVRVM